MDRLARTDHEVLDYMAGTRRRKATKENTPIFHDSGLALLLHGFSGQTAPLSDDPCIGGPCPVSE